jgi:hypothetical protein
VTVTSKSQSKPTRQTPRTRDGALEVFKTQSALNSADFRLTVAAANHSKLSPTLSRLLGTPPTAPYSFTSQDISCEQNGHLNAVDIFCFFFVDTFLVDFLRLPCTTGGGPNHHHTQPPRRRANMARATSRLNTELQDTHITGSEAQSAVSVQDGEPARTMVPICVSVVLSKVRAIFDHPTNHRNGLDCRRELEVW